MSLPALARVDRILLSILMLGALLVAVLHWLLAAPEKSGGLVRMPSTYFNVATGAKAAYDVLDELNYPVTRLRHRISLQSLQGVGTLFILRPSEGLAREEVAILEDWIKQGHALVLVPGKISESFSPTRQDDKDREFLDDWFAWKDPPPGPEKQTDAFPSSERKAFLREIEPEGGIMAGIAQLAVPEGRRFDRQSTCQGDLEGVVPHAFWKDERGFLGLRIKYDDGVIIAFADEYPLTNIGIGETDNGLLLANVARELSKRYPGKLAFDEFHLGFAEHDVSPVAIVKLMLAGPWRWAAVQACLLGALALFARGVRFGSPQGVIRKPRRQHREFAEAAGRLFEEAGATSLAAETLYGYYRDWICRVLLLERTVDDRQLCEGVQRRAGPALAAELRQAQEALKRPLSRQKLLSVSQKLHRVAETLDHGT